MNGSGAGWAARSGYDAPLCTNCHWFWANLGRYRDVCTRPVKFSVVRGTEMDASPVDYQRARWVLWPSRDRCGPDGKHWEARRPMPTPPPSQKPGR